MPRRPFLISVYDFENHKLFVVGEAVLYCMTQGAGLGCC